MAYLKHKDTGEIYPVNEHLLKRGDMIACDIDGNVVEHEEAVSVAKAPRKPRAKKEAVVEDAPEIGDLDLDLGDE